MVIYTDKLQNRKSSIEVSELLIPSRNIAWGLTSLTPNTTGFTWPGTVTWKVEKTRLQMRFESVNEIINIQWVKRVDHRINKNVIIYSPSCHSNPADFLNCFFFFCTIEATGYQNSLVTIIIQNFFFVSAEKKKCFKGLEWHEDE